MNVYRKTPLYLLCSFIVCFASCKKGNKVTPQNPGKNLVLTSFEQQKVTADNAFTLRLFKNLDSTNGIFSNLFASPLSVSFALGMTSNGAAGTTLTAFKNTLNFSGLTQDQVNAYYNNLVTNLPQLDPNTTLNIANSIWYRQGFSVQPAFLKTDSTNFNAQIKALDFSSPPAVGTINNWVNDKTNGKIPKILDNIPGNAVMYLVNAMYFKSSWKEKFDPAKTKPQPFYLADNSNVLANFMTGNIDFNYYVSDKANVYELPYSNNKYSMVIITPGSSIAGSGTTLSQLAAGLDSLQWESWMSKLQPTKGTVTMPKFAFSYGNLLNSALTDLGLGIAFSDGADFSLINPTAKLQISQVVHKAFVEVDESGTTAAAATSVGIIATVAGPQYNPTFNHPFIFAIREMSSGLILFIGTMNNPLLTGN
ncbi:serpin family protein [Mucilaginibacter gotjawali]|uniref:Serpin B n=2 Tax=Mucilaginibacter gotjawali TaxID=1550579 RepID=A0A839SHN7_9SPHI|nr:serpin family protein [Mucilaginibacter gotjawali]MBB3057821.1 serpin B [Mucilaginibacter gotjawali]BAU52622.1 Serpin (serine protease inhibitor) [Mucilaginibacter gotjawali]